MNARVLALCLLPVCVHAQGFAGLGTDATGFAVPQPDPVFDFPADHGAHPAYRIEWWYLTANMTGPDGTPYGLQWTLFRSALAPEAGSGWTAPQLWMGHAAVTTSTAHYVSERLARGGVGQAGVTTDPFAAWIDEWEMAGDWQTALTLSASAPDFAYDVTLTPGGPLVLQGDKGYSVKSAAGQASYYYSAPFLDLAGTLTLPEGDVAVTGTAWIDREWSSQPLTSDQTGWDWFSLSFDDGAKMMGYALRDRTGAGYTVGTWISASGEASPFPNGSLTATPTVISDIDGRQVPTTWRLELPARGLDVTVAALNTQAWMNTSFPYWEGPVTVAGSHSGVGYLEMTGHE